MIRRLSIIKDYYKRFNKIRDLWLYFFICDSLEKEIRRNNFTGIGTEIEVHFMKLSLYFKMFGDS